MPINKRDDDDDDMKRWIYVKKTLKNFSIIQGTYTYHSLWSFLCMNVCFSIIYNNFCEAFSYEIVFYRFSRLKFKGKYAHLR